MDLLLRPWRHYADFQGRSRRSEYWLFVLQTIVVAFILMSFIGFGTFFDPTGAGLLGLSGGALGVLTVFWLATIIPSLAVGVRRLHDAGLSGWLMLIGLIPYLGGLILLVLVLLPPNNSTNAYGPDPRDPSASIDELSRTFS